MRSALITMLDMQHRMNTRVHPHWQTQNFAWYRALWIECAELLDHYGYKWWKKQSPDMAHVQLEVIDIWHFGLSALLAQQDYAEGDEAAAVQTVADNIIAKVENYTERGVGVRDATEALAAHALNEHGFSVTRFWDLMSASDLDFDQLYRSYVGKNVLNFFRQDYGYQEGTYQKTWDGREDNEHLLELMNTLDSGSEDFGKAVYRALSERYQALGPQA